LRNPAAEGSFAGLYLLFCYCAIFYAAPFGIFVLVRPADRNPRLAPDNWQFRRNDVVIPQQSRKNILI